MLESWAENFILRRVCVMLAQMAAAYALSHHTVDWSRFGITAHGDVVVDAHALADAMFAATVAGINEARHFAIARWPWLEKCL